MVLDQGECFVTAHLNTLRSLHNLHSGTGAFVLDVSQDAFVIVKADTNTGRSCNGDILDFSTILDDNSRRLITSDCKAIAVQAAAFVNGNSASAAKIRRQGLGAIDGCTGFDSELV